MNACHSVQMSWTIKHFQSCSHTQKAQTNQKLKDLLSFFPYMYKELRKTGVTRKLLWEEYKARYPDGYQVTQFCLHYSRWKSV